MKERPYFKFYPADWMNSVSVTLMDHEQRGAFLHLLCLCWIQEDCALVAAAKQLLGLCHWSGTPERFIVVEKMFKKHPNCDGLTNLRLYDEFLKCSTYSESQAKKGKIGGLARARQRLSRGLAKPKPERSQIEIRDKREEYKRDKSDWLPALRADPLWSHIDFEEEFRKIARWKQIPKNAHRIVTKTFFVQWLTRVETPMKMNGVAGNGASMTKAMVKVTASLPDGVPPPLEVQAQLRRLGVKVS